MRYYLNLIPFLLLAVLGISLLLVSKYIYAYPSGNWAEVGYGSSKQIAVGNDRNGSLVVFSISVADNAIYYKQQLPNGTWSSEWIPFGGASKQIAVGNDRNGSLVVFSIGTADNAIYHKQQLPNGTWSSEWISLGGESKQIAVGNDRNGSLVVFSIGMADNAIYHKQQLPNGTWSTEWISLGGESKQIAVGNDIRHKLAILSIGFNNDIPHYKQQLPNGTWSSEWISLGGESKQIAVGNDRNGSLVVFSIGTADNAIYHKQQLPNGTWSTEWISLGGANKQILASKQISVISSDDDYGPYVISIADYDSFVYFWYTSNNYTGSNGIPIGGFSSAVTGMAGENNDPHIFSIASGSIFEYKTSTHPIFHDDDFASETFFNGNLSRPDTATTSMAFLDSDNIILLQKNDGKVRLISNGTILERPLLDLNVSGLGERGLLGIAIKDIVAKEREYVVDPNSKKFVFLYLTEAPADGSTALGNRLYRYEFNGTDLNSPVLLLNLPSTFVNHNSGKIKVASDGSIFVIIGDQNRTGIFQNLNISDTSPTGVIYHIDSAGNPVPQNPFYNLTSNKLIQSIYAYGIRNSFGLAIDPVTGNLWQTENGDTEYDEINQIFPGFNGGWKVISGPAETNDENKLVLLPNSRYSDPKLSFRDTIGITDLEFVTSDLYGPSKFGSLLAADINNGNLYLFKLNSTRNGFVLDSELGSDKVVKNNTILMTINIAARFGSGITDIEADPDGRLYILTLGGKIYRLVHG